MFMDFDQSIIKNIILYDFMQLFQNPIQIMPIDMNKAFYLYKNTKIDNLNRFHILLKHNINISLKFRYIAKKKNDIFECNQIILL